MTLRFASRIPLITFSACSVLVLTSLVYSQAPAQEAPAPAGLSADDWSGVRAAYEANRHAVRAVDGGYQAANPGQRWSTRFDGRGSSTQPDAGGWTWGLELSSYGWQGRERQVTKPVRVGATGGRVAYRWDATLEEWYFNDRRGLEHGFTVMRCPTGEGNGEDLPLCFTLAVRGALRPEVAAGGRTVSFKDGEGATILTYAGLTVFDADGRDLQASLEHAGDRLRLSVDERGARYPLTIDPIVQQAYLKASNTDGGDYFGESIAVSGDTIVVGAYGEDSSATGVNGMQASNSALWAGAAYVFVRSATGWSQQAYLKASNNSAGDHFGGSVAVSGNTIVVGATGESRSANWAGAAYVFVRTGTSWSQQAYLKASNSGPYDAFGWSVAVSGDTIVVGATGEDSSATGVNGNQTSNSTPSAGAAYVFVRSATGWSEQAYLKASNTDRNDHFGELVAVSGDTIVVGAWGEDSSATGVNGMQAINSASDAGAAYVFVRTGTSWSQQAYLKASNTDAKDLFGASIAVSGDTIVVGAWGEDSSATGVNGMQAINSAPDAGAAYVFVRSATGWSQQAYLKASNTDAGDQFGGSVAVSGDTIVVGAEREDSPSIGVNGTQRSNRARWAGAAYVFVRGATSWRQRAYLKASNTDAWDQFGESVAVSGGSVVVGAPQEDSYATGVNGNQANNNLPDSGAAYVFSVPGWFDQGCAFAGVSGEPRLIGTGSLNSGSSNSFALSGAAARALAVLGLASSSAPVEFLGGTLKPFPIAGTFVVFTSASGTFSLPFTMPSGVPAGTQLWAQFGILDVAAVHGLALSNAIQAITP